MGWLNDLWSQADFWDKEENARQKQAAQTRKTQKQSTPAQTKKKPLLLNSNNPQRSLGNAGMNVVSTPKPKQNPWDKFTDIFDANSAMDRYHRQKAGQAELYQDQQRAKGIADSSIEINPFGRALQTGQKFAEGVIEAPVAFGRSTGSYFGMKGGDYKAGQAAEDINRDVITNKNIEMLKLINDPNVDLATKQRAANFLNNSESFTGMDEVRAKIASDTDPRRMAAAGVSLLADLATLGVAGASKAGIKGAYTAAKGTQTGVKGVTTGLVAGGRRFGIDTAKTAGLGAIAGGTSAYIQDPNATFKQALQGAGMGAAGGAVLPTAMIGVQSIPATTRLVGRGAVKAGKAIDNYGKPKGAKLAQLNAREAKILEDLPNVEKILDNAERIGDTAKVKHYRQVHEAYMNELTNIRSKKSGSGGFVANPFYKDGTMRPGVTKDRIFDGVDGKPRVEFSDEGAKLNTKAISKTAMQQKTGNARMKLGEALDHKELYKQYPELKDTEIVFEPNMRENGKYFRNRDGVDTIYINSDRSIDEQTKTLIHEIQHNIQRKEGFARGGSDAEFGVPMQKKHDLLTKQIEDYNNKLEKAVGTPEYAQLMDEKLTLVKEIQKLEGKYTGTIQEKAIEEYQKFAGEAEARAVANRMNMTDGERYKKTPAMYHGTDAQFDKFDATKVGTQKYADWGDGVYFDPRKSGADYYRKEAVAKRSPEVQKAYKNYEDTLNRLGTKPMYESIDLGYGTPKFLEANKARKAYVAAVEKVKSDQTKGRIIESYLKKDAKVKDVYVSGTPDPTIGKQAKADGYDAVRIHTGPKGDPDTFLDEILVLNTDAIKNTPDVRSTFYDSLDVPKEDLIIRNGTGKSMSVDPLESLKQEARRLNPNLAVEDLSETRLRIAIDTMKQQATKEYKDAGNKMFGSRKDLAKLGVVDTDKLVGLENEGARVANKHVTKSRVLGDNAKYKVDRNGNPSLENLKKIYHSGIPSKPADSPQARAWYVKNMPGFAEKIKNATSLEEIDRAAKELITNERGYLSMEAREYLGARSFNILRGRSEAVSRAKWNPATDFSFDEVKKTTTAKPKSKVTLHGGEQVEYARTVGKTLKDKSPKAVANEFGFKGVEYGNYVGDQSANTHITKFADSMLDLEDEMGMNLTELNKQMKLGAAFGSRGQGGRAIAHYEPSNKVINITKKNTVDGSLAHEYIHALDDFLGDGKKMNEYASSGRASNPRVNEAMREVMEAIKEGDGGVTVTRKPNIRYGNAPKLDALLKEAKTAQGALDLYTQKYKGASVKNKKKIADYFMSKTGEDEVVLKTGRSNMFEAADAKGEYWKRDTELFARAYADLVRDRLSKKGVKNNYITYETPRDSLWTPDDLNKFGEKMDNLLKVVKEEYGIGDVPTRKTLEAVTSQPKTAPKTVEKTAPTDTLKNTANKFKNKDEFIQHYVDNQKEIPITKEYNDYFKKKDTLGNEAAKLKRQWEAIESKYHGVKDGEYYLKLDPAKMTKAQKVAAEAEWAKGQEIYKKYQKKLSEISFVPLPDGTVKTIDHIGEKGFRNQLSDLYDEVVPTSKPTLQDALDGKSTKPKIDPDVQEVIDDANQAIKNGDFEEAKLLSAILPEEHSALITKKIAGEQAKAESDILRSVQNDLAMGVASDAAENNINTAIKGVADKLGKHFNAPRATYKLTGFQRNYTTPSGTLKVGGDFKAAFDRTFMTGDITTFSKNIKILADKYGGAFREISDTLDTGVLDDVDYDKLTGELYERISKRPAYSRRPSPTAKSVSKGNAKATATGKGIIDGNKKQLVTTAPATKPKVAPKKTTVKKPVPQISEEMALVKTAKQPPTKPPKPPTGNAEIPALGTGKMKKSRFASKTIPESENVSAPIRKKTKEGAPLYAQENEKVRFNQSLTKYEKMGRDKFADDVMDRLDVKKGSIESQDVVDAEVLAAKLDAEGKYPQASDIYTKLSEHLTKAGQTVQAAAIMARRSPQGARRHAQKAIEKSGVKFTKGMAKDLNQLTKELAAAKTDHDRQFALFLIGEFVKKNTKTSMADKIVNTWRAGLLTSPVTTAGNLMANTGETAIRKGFVNPVASAADAVMGKFTGRRTMAIAPSGSGTKGFTKGAKTLPEYMKTGFQESDALQKAKYENSGNIHFGDGPLGKTLGAYVNGTYRLMGVADAPFRYTGMEEALGSMAKAKAITKGLKGKAQKEFIDDFVKNPPKDALEQATKEGYYASFQNDTLLNDMAQGLKQKLERSSKGGPTAKAVADFVMPFVRTPSAIATRLVERTPIGIAKETVKQIRNVKAGRAFDQRAMSQAIGNGTFGAVAIGAGMTLAQQDLLTFGYPSDQKERDLWEMEGKQPYSVKVGNRWYSMNYLQPFGTLLAIGGQAKQDMDNGSSGGEAATKALATAAQSIQDQSFLKGISGILDMIGDPERSARRYMEQTASSVVPNFIRGAARASDDVQRKPTTVGESVASAIPGLRQTTPVKFDALGRPIPAKDNFLNQYVNPTRPSKIRNDALTSELRRLKDDDLATMPTDISKNTFGEQNLSKAQINAATQYTNKRVSDEWAKIVKTQEYKNLTDEQKKKTLDRVKRDYHAVAKAEWAAKNNLINDKYEPKLSSTQKQIAMGDAPDYVYGGLPKNLSQTAKNIIVDAEGKDDNWKNAKSNNKEVQNTIQKWVGDKYQLPQITNYVAKQWADFEKQRAEGTLNSIEASKKQATILKSAFKSAFDDTTRSFYSLGDDAMRNELNKGTISKEQMDKVIEIDNALTALGLQKYPQVGKKLRRELGYGQIASSSGSRSRSSGGRSGGSGRSKSLGMDYKLFGFGDPKATSKSLRNLLEEALV